MNLSSNNPCLKIHVNFYLHGYQLNRGGEAPMIQYLQPEYKELVASIVVLANGKSASD
jgi:hypothetical protein